MESLEDWLTQPDGVATRLRALRVQAGLSGKDLAEAGGWAQSKVSRIETGQQMPSEDDIRAWGRACGASDEIVAELLADREEARIANTTFRKRMRGGQAAVQDSYAELARNATLIRHFETAFVPGPLQVPEYARWILTEMRALHEVAVDDVVAAVKSRMQRAQMLYDPAKRFEFLLAEPVLRWLPCPPAVMRAQLDRLHTAIGLDRVRFGIIPMGVRLATTPQSTFEIYNGAEEVAVAETFIGETFHRGDEAVIYGRALDRLWADAAEGDDARVLIVRAVRSLPDDA